jgi:TonB family protein
MIATLQLQRLSAAALVLFCTANCVIVSASASDTPPDATMTRARIEPGCKRPAYPGEALKNGDTGDVELSLSIAASGELQSVSVLKSSGHPALDQAAADAITACRFAPALRNGAAVDSKLRMKHSWTPEQLQQARALALGKSNQLHEDARTGSNIRRAAFASVLPLKKRYHELSAEQQAYVRGFYESMPENDEPPYPANGLASVLQPIQAVQRRLRVDGVVSLEVQIDSQGKATAVDILSAPSDELARAAGSIAMLAPYKPAVCGGQPCAMAFPIRLNFLPTH